MSSRWRTFAVSAVIAIIAPFLPALEAVSAQGLEINPDTAMVGPIRYTETSGVQDSVYGASLVAVSDPFSENPVTSDDTVVMTLQNVPTANATIWLRKVNGVFPAAGATADDSISLAKPMTTPATLSSATWFNLVNGTAIDDTVLQTFFAVNAPGVYSGVIQVFEGSAPTMSAATLEQTTTFQFATAGAPTAMKIDRTKAQLIASPSDRLRALVSLRDADGKPTQMTPVDSIVVTSSSTSIATTSPTTLTAADFDDTTPYESGSALLTISGGSTAGTATLTLAPSGTLPSTGVQAQTLEVSTRPLATQAPTALRVTIPQDQIVKSDASTDETTIYNVNDAYVVRAVVTGTGATPDSGVVAYVSANSSNWTNLYAAQFANYPTAISNGASNVPVALLTDGSGQTRIEFAWSSVSDGGQITVRIGSGSQARWTVINVIDSEWEPTTTPSGRLLEKSGTSIDFEVSIVDNFGNPYSGLRVSGRAYASSGFPVGALSSAATTDSSGQAFITVAPPDDTYAGTARVVFRVTLSSGLPVTTLQLPDVLVTYSVTGEPTALTVGQAQSTPSTIGPLSTITAYPDIVVPYLGYAETADGAPGTWNASTSSGTPQGTMVTFLPQSSPATQIGVTVGEGARLTTSTSAPWDGGESEVWVESGDPVYAFSTKTGTFDVHFTVGRLTTTAKFKVSTIPDAAYDVAISPASQDLAQGGFGRANVYVTDAFGNPVPRTTDDSGGVLVTTQGQLLLSGMQNRAVVTTDDSGQGLITIIAAKAAGEGQLLVTPTPSTRVAAWQPGFEPPTGFAPPVTETSASVRILGVSESPSISITGSRGTVKGRSGVILEGQTVNVDPSQTLVPWVRLQGQSAFTAGSAVITPDAEGAFTWQRRTGKKVYVYVMTSDGLVRSNRIAVD